MKRPGMRAKVGWRAIAVVAALVMPVVAARAQDPGGVLERAMAGRAVPAMGLAVLRERHVAALAVRGVRRIDGDDPVRADDLWHIGSDAKAMTATMIARLVERGVLHWDDRVDRVLPELAATSLPQYRRASLADLLGHRSGLPHDLVDPGARAVFFSDSGPGSLTQKRLSYVARAMQDRPVGPLGAFAYSNTGYLLAVAMAERASGRSYEDLMTDEVFAPLGIDRVRFGTTVPGEVQGHRHGHATGALEGNPLFFAPAGNLVLSLEDWARFCLDQLDGARGQGRLLSRAGYRRLQVAREGCGYGMGWEVARKYAGRAGPVLVHAGSDTSWYAIAVLFPERGTGALVVANAGADMGGEAADRAALDDVLPDLAPPAQ